MATATHGDPRTLTGTASLAPMLKPSRTPNAAERADLRRMLEQQERFRVEQLAALGAPDATGPFTSSVDEIARSLAAGARAALRDVRDALARMDEGRFGLCVACSIPLGIERLEILPQVARCMPCQRVADDITSSQRTQVPVGAPGTEPSATA